MKKKLLFVIMVCAVLALAVVLVGCGQSKLANPRNLNFADGYFMWGEVKGADGYLIYFNDDLVNRYYVEKGHNYLAVDDPEIRSSLKSGVVNEMYIRAVNLDKSKLPINASDRSLIKFDYSRQLATPNKVTLKGDKFSWRAVSEAKDYQAYVRQDGKTEGKLYKMTWATGTASVSGKINDLPNGFMYYVSIVACCEGFENSVPSVEVPYDRSVVNVDQSQYFALVDGNSIRLTEGEEDGVFAAALTLKADSTITVQDNAGKTFDLTKPTLVNGDYEIKFNVGTGAATLTKVTNYYVFVGSATEGVKLSLADGGYSAAVSLSDGMTYVVKDDEGNVLSTYADDSVNQGTAFTGGNYTVFVSSSTKEITVKAGGTVVNNDESTDGKWKVTLHYNYPNCPEDIIVYAEDGRTMATPATPVRNGFIFVGWYEDAYCLIEAKFTAKLSYFKITAPTDLYAKWTVDTSNDPDPTPDPGPDPTPGPDPVDPQPLPDCDYHVDANGDGKCDKCTRDMPVVQDTTGKIYLNVSKYDWFDDENAVINVHIWYADGTNNNWPGAKMTLNANGLYEADYYTSRVVKGIIFTRNDPNPNPNEGTKTEWDRIEIGEIEFNQAKPVYYLNSYRHADEVIEFTGKWLGVDEEAPSYVTGDKKAYVDFREVDWFASAGAKIYAYVWYTDESKNAEYPGKEMVFTNAASMTQYSAYIEYTSEKTLAGIIITRNNPNLPITGSGDGLWNKIEVSTALGNLGLTAALPALRLTAVNGNDFQGNWESEEAALSGNPVIVVNPEPDPEPDPEWNGTVTVDLSSVTLFGNDCVPYLYVWYSDESNNAVYPGAKMTATGEAGKYTYVISTTKTVVGMIVVRVSADETTMFNKTVNYSLPNNHIVYVKDSDFSEIPMDERTIGGSVTPDPGPVQTMTVYYYNNTWATVKAYAWSGTAPDTTDYLDAWPGRAMTAVAGKAGWWKIDVNKNATKIIFNDGGSNKTEDLTLNESTLYYKTGWTATYPADPEPWDGTLTVNITWEYFGTADAYLYVWYGTNPETKNAVWPGVKMTKTGTNTFTGTIDTSKPFAGLIVVRCDPATGDVWNQSGDITFIPDNHTITISSMS